MMKGSNSVKDRLERRKLLGAIGVSPLAGVDVAEIDRGNESSILTSNDKINTVHFVTAELTHVGDIPGTLLGDQDGWSRYKFTEQRIILNELLTASQRELFETSSEIIHLRNRSLEAPPLSVSEAPLDVLQVKTPESNSTRSIGLSEPYDPPSATIRTKQNNSITLEQNKDEDITIIQGQTEEVEYKEKTIHADVGDYPSEFEIKPIIKVANHGEIPVYDSAEDTENFTERDDPFTIGSGDSVKKIEE